MASVGDVKRWNPGSLNRIATTMQQREQVLIHSGDDFGRIVPVEGWTGTAADSAASEHQGLMGRMDSLVAGASVVHKALMQASDAIPAVQNAIHAAEELARKYAFDVGDDGRITDTLAGKPPPELSPEDRQRALRQVTDDIAQALRTADDIDADLTSVFQRAARGEIGGGNDTTVAAAAAAGAADPGLTLPEPPPNATPSQNAAWWAALSGAGQKILLRDHPEWLGNLDGLPGAVRSQANTARLPRERAALEQQRTAAQAAVDQAKGVYDPTGNTMANALRDRATVEAKLHSLDKIEETLHRPGERQLLTLDTSGKRVKAAIGLGNIDIAKHVAVFTPGFTSTVDGKLENYDSDMQNMQKHSQNLSDRYGDHGLVATVTWIGYEAPQADEILDGDRSVVSDEQAKIGAGKLNGFLNGIGASHQTTGHPLHLTALGHSYGSLTTGIALQQETPVNDAVVFGSPGLGAETRADLRVPEGHMFSAWSDQDSVPSLDVGNHFGASPYHDASRIASDSLDGISRLSTENAVGVDGQPLRATHEHGQYLEEGSTSQYNMASVIVGRSDLQIPHVPPESVPSQPPPSGQPIPAPPGRTPQPPPR